MYRSRDTELVAGVAGSRKLPHERSQSESPFVYTFSVLSFFAEWSKALPRAVRYRAVRGSGEVLSAPTGAGCSPHSPKGKDSCIRRLQKGGTMRMSVYALTVDAF